MSPERSVTYVSERFSLSAPVIRNAGLPRLREVEPGLLSRPCPGKQGIPNFKTLDIEVRAWNRDVNRTHTSINWNFDRRAAPRNFGYNARFIRRSED